MSPLKLVPFPKESTNSLLSWISNAEELQFWSGNTFKNGLNKEIFLSHLQRNDLYSFSFRDDSSSLLAYGEVVQGKNNQAVLCRGIVNPRERRKGIGKQFVADVMEWVFDEKKMYKITLNALGNNLPARKCYLSLGFRIIGVKRNYRWISNQWRDLVVMEKLSAQA